MSDLEKRRLAALEKLLDGEPPYPVGSVVRQLQDERDTMRRQFERDEDARQEAENQG